MLASKNQKQYIYKLCNYKKDLKAEAVQWATNSTEKTSTNDLTFSEANKIIVQLGGTPERLDNWALFDKNKTSHRKILSLCIQLGWRIKNHKYGWLADTTILNQWLHSDKCPVKKPLKEMKPAEVSKIVGALEGILKRQYK